MRYNQICFTRTRFRFWPVPLSDRRCARALPTKRGQALLSYLLLNNAQVHTRTALAEFLWPEQPEKKSRQNLRQTLTRMRQDLGVGLIHGDLLPLPDPFTTDYHTLQVDASLFAVDALQLPRRAPVLRRSRPHRRRSLPTLRRTTAPGIGSLPGRTAGRPQP
ncbi:MAG: winged helix-turn-helix domain-containing protein [Caldilineaceae bacterium]